MEIRVEILDTLISKEITTISNQNELNYASQWKLVIKANGEEFRPLTVDSITIDKLFVGNYADELMVSCSFVADQYYQGILPYRNKLEATLIKVPLLNITHPTRDTKAKTYTNSYIAQLVVGDSDIISGDNPLAVNKGQASQLSIVPVQIQLYNPVIDHIRKTTFGTVFRDTLPMDALRYVLMKVGKPDVAEVNNTIRGIDIAAGYTQEPRKHIVVPHMSKLIEIPNIINEEIGGFYPTGFTYYLQRGNWFIFPPYDSQRFGKQTPSLTIIKIPSWRMPNMDRTYRFTDTQVIVLSTKETIHRDMSEASQLNDGNAVRFVDSNSLMENFGERGENKLKVSARKNVTEVVSQERPEGDYITTGNKLVTNDYNQEYSRLALKNGSIIQTQWDNSDPDLLVPGMPVRYIFADGEETREMYGTLQAAEVLNYRTNVNAAEGRFVALTLLTIFVSRDDPTKKPNKQTTSKTVTK